MNKFFTKGVRYMLISVSAFAIMNLVAKSLVEFSWSEVVFYRSISTLIIALGLIYNQGINVWGNQHKLLVLRSVTGTIAMSCFFAALKILPLTTTVSIRYLAPIFGAIMAVVFLKDRIKPIQWFFFLLAFSGVLILKGFDTRISNLGLIIVLISAVFTGSIYVIIQKIGKRDHPLVIVAYFMTFTSITGLVFTGLDWQSPTSSEWFSLLSLGILGFVGQLYMTKALQEESTGRVAPLKYFEAVFVFILGWIWLGETYTWIPILGMTLIIVGMVLNVVVSKK